jgi:hypothetical protein
MALGLSPLVHGQLAMDPIKWPPYNPKLEYDFAKETAKIPAPKKVLDDGVVV